MPPKLYYVHFLPTGKHSDSFHRQKLVDMQKATVDVSNVRHVSCVDEA
jgi:hypothetical protein